MKRESAHKRKKIRRKNKLLLISAAITGSFTIGAIIYAVAYFGKAAVWPSPEDILV